MDDNIYSIPRLRRRLALKGDLSWMLWDQQIPIYNTIRNLPGTVDEFVVLCARQFGKSHLGVLLAIEDAIRYRDRCIVIIGPDTKQTKEIVNPRMRRIQGHLPEGLLVQSKSENKWIVYHDMTKNQKNFSEIVIGGMNENSSSQRGKTVQTIFVEEVVESNPDDYLESLRSDLGPALTHSQDGKIVFLTTLPKYPDHPFITDTLASARLHNALAIFTIEDNKALTPEQYEACIRRAGGRESDEFKREYLCQVVRDSSIVVVPAFNEKVHVRQVDIPTFTRWNIMVDWGGVRDYTVGLLYTYDYLRNKLLFVDEFLCRENTATNVIWSKINAWRKAYNVGIECIRADAPGQTLVDIAVYAKESISLPDKSDWQAGINNLNVRFSLNELEVDNKCRFLIESLRSGTFNKHRTDFERTKALGHCDAIASMGYAIRHYDYDNPYPNSTSSGNNHFVRPKRDEEIELTGMVGRSF
jgi:hypothetical protein